MKKKCLKYVGFEYFPCEIFYIQFHPSDDTKLLQKDFTKFDYEETEFFGKLGAINKMVLKSDFHRSSQGYVLSISQFYCPFTIVFPFGSPII